MRQIKIKLVLISIIILLGMAIFAAPVLGGSYVRIIQTVPPEVYANYSSGQHYQVLLRAEGDATSQEVVARLVLPTGFTYKTGSMTAVYNKISGPPENLAVNVVGSSGTVNISFAPTINMAVGESILLSYDLIASAAVTPGNTNILRVETDYHDTVSHTEYDEVLLDVKWGLVTLTLTPINPAPPAPFQARRGQTIILEARITNDGDGPLYNVNFRTDWGTGFGNAQLVSVGSDATNVELTPALSGTSYQTTCSEIPAGHSVFFRYRLTVVGYENFPLNSTAIDPVRGTYTRWVAFSFIMNQPNITITPEAINIAYGTSAHTKIQVTNTSTDEGPARRFVLNTNINNTFTVTNVASGWTYNDGVFTYNANGGVINPTQSLELTFDVTLAFPCALHGDASGAIIIRPSYFNDIDQNFTYPITTQSYSISGVPTITLAQTIITGSTDGDNRRLFLTESFRYEFTPTLTNFANWSSSNIVFRDTLTGDFAFDTMVDPDGWNVTAGTVVVNGREITWTLTPAEVAASPNPKLAIYVKVTDDWNRAGFTLSNTATISGSSSLGCSISAWMSTYFYLQSRDEPALFDRETKSITNPPTEGSFDVCGASSGKNRIEYQLDYRFGDSSGGLWTGSTLTEGMERNQVYVPGTAQYCTSVDGVNWSAWNNIPDESLISSTPFSINLSFLRGIFGGNDLVRGRKVRFKYQLALTNESLLPGSAGVTTFVARTDLMLEGAANGAVIDGKHHFYEGVYVPISRELLRFGAAFGTNYVSKGQTVPITITVNKNTPWNNNDLTLIVNTNGRYSYRGNLAISGFGGVIPTVTINPQYPDTITLTFTSPITAGGTVTFDLVKTDASNYTIATQMYYDDELDIRYTTSGNYTPDFQLQGVLSLVSSPNPVQVNNNTVEWEMLVTNIGDGTAFGVTLKDVLKEVLTYSSSTVNGSPAVPAPIRTPGTHDETITWSLGDLTPGASVAIHVVAVTSGLSSDFTNANTLTGYMNWTDRDGGLHPFNYTEATVSPGFTELTSSTFVKNNCASAVELADNATLELYVKNNGLTTNYNYTITQSLGTTGFTYVPGSAKIKHSGITEPIAEPVLSDSGNTLTFSYGSIALLGSVAPQQEFTIIFDVDSHETYNGNQQIQASATWQKPTEKEGLAHTGNTTGALYRVPQILPYIDVLVDGKNITAHDANYTENVIAVPGDEVEWRIQIRNDFSQSAADLKNVTLKNILPTNMSFISIDRYESTKGTDPVTRAAAAANTLWQIANILKGQTATYLIRATFNGSCGPVQTDSARVSWGPETSSVMRPGDFDDDANLITQPIVVQPSAVITGFTTKIGAVTVTITNNGAPIYNFTLPLNISDRFTASSNCVYSAGIAGPDVHPVIGTSGSGLSWHWNGPIPAGTYTITFNIRDNSAAQNCNNGNAVSSTNNYSYRDIQDHSLSGSYNFNQTPAKTTLTITKAPTVELATVGTTFTWTITVTNTGNATATNLEIIDTLGDGFTYVSSSVTGRPDMPTQGGDGRVLTWSGITLNVGASYVITLRATVNAAGLRTNSVTATEWNIDKTQWVDQKSAKSWVIIASFTKAIDQTLLNVNDSTADSFGEIVKYTITFDINDDINYQGLKIQDTLPTGLQYLDDTVTINNGKTSVTTNHSGKNLEWNFSSFSGPERITIAYHARIVMEGAVQRGSILRNNSRAGFTAQFSDGSSAVFPNTLGRLRSRVPFTVNEPVLTLSRTAIPATGSQVRDGDTINHAIVVTNSNNANVSPAYGLRVTETLPVGERVFNPAAAPTTVVVKKGGSSGITLTDSDYTVSYNGTDLIFTFLNTNLGILKKGEDFTISYQTKVDSGIGATRNLINSAAINQYYSQPETTVGRRAYSVAPQTVTFSTTNSDSSLTVKIPDDKKVAPGMVVTYEAKVIVHNGTSVYDIRLSQVLPDGLQFKNGSSVGPGAPFGNWTPSVSGQTITWSTALNNHDLVNNSGGDIELTIVFNAVVTDDTVNIQDGDVLRSTLFYGYNTINNDNTSLHNAPDVWDTVTVAEADLKISKSGPATIELNQATDFLINISNVGNGIAWQPRIRDVLPLQMSLQTPVVTSISVGLVGVPARSLTEGADYDLSYASGSGEWLITFKSNRARIEPSEILTINYRARLNNAVFGTDLIRNTAYVNHYYSADTSGGLPTGVRTYTPTLEAFWDILIHTPIIVSTCVVDKPIASPGEVVHFRVTLTNNGNTPVNDSVYTLSAGDKYATGTITNVTTTSGSASTNPSGGAFGHGGFNITGLDIADGGSVSIEWDITLRTGLVHGVIAEHQSELTVANFPAAINVPISQVTINSANVSGTVWWDSNLNNSYSNPDDAGESRAGGWGVAVLEGTTVITTTTTAADGSYSFIGMVTGVDYRIRFTHLNGSVWNISNVINLNPGVPAVCDLPLHPSGVIYDAVTRLPVAGARVNISYMDAPNHFIPVSTNYLLSGQQGQETGADGAYRFDVLFANGAPTGTYQITVIPPLTYSPTFPSTLAPPRPGLGPNLGTNPNPPAMGVIPVYYRLFELNAGSPEIIFNHIPLDPVLEGSVILTKTCGRKSAAIGEILSYSIKLENTLAAAITPMTLLDRIPAGFKYITGTAKINGVKAEPSGMRTLSWTGLTLPPEGTMVITYSLVVGSGVTSGQIYRNTAIACNGINGKALSNTGVAQVQIIDEPIFSNSFIIGKVFNDINGNGIQDQGEAGIAGARLVTVGGLIITTDSFGRYHLDEVKVKDFSKGRNFIIKLDSRSVPKGSRFTTENPRVVRVTQGMIVKVNFGVQLPVVYKEPVSGKIQPEPQQTPAMVPQPKLAPEPSPQPELLPPPTETSSQESAATAAASPEDVPGTKPVATPESNPTTGGVLGTPPPKVSVPVPAPVPEPKVSTLEKSLQPIYFDYNKVNIRDDQISILEQDLIILTDYLKERPKGYVVLGGHTDSRGTVAYNDFLAGRRVETVRDYLIAKGINPERIVCYIYGKHQPLKSGEDELSWAINRRVDVLTSESQVPTKGTVKEK